MTLQLSPDEPEAGWWRAERITDVAAALLKLGRSRGADHRLLQRPWERADLVACGTPEISLDPAVELAVSSRPEL